MSRLLYCQDLDFDYDKQIGAKRKIAMNARMRRRRRYINALFLATAVTTLCAPIMFNVDTDNSSFYGLSGQKIEHVITNEQTADIKRKVTVPLLAGYIGKTNSVMASDFTAADVTYTGSWAWVDDGTINGQKAFRIRFLTSGTFTPAKAIVIDVFLVGGGGGGGSGAAGGGAGGYTGTYTSVTINANTPYTITVGSGGIAGTALGSGGTGGSTSAFGYTKAGGNGGTGYNYGRTGGNGGSGGGGSYRSVGGSNGSNGGSDTYAGGTGQNSTTREFGDASGTLYAGGGGASKAAGGDGGGGAGGQTTGAGVSGTVNTGGGGGSSGTDGPYNGGAGGSGICIIRNHR